MPWVLMILVVFVGMAAQGLGSFFAGNFDEEQLVDAYLRASQRYFSWNLDDRGNKPDFGPEALRASQSVLPSEEFRWPQITLDLNRDEAPRLWHFQQFWQESSAVPVPASFVLLASGLAIVGAVGKWRKR